MQFNRSIELFLSLFLQRILNPIIITIFVSNLFASCTLIYASFKLKEGINYPKSLIIFGVLNIYLYLTFYLFSLQYIVPFLAVLLFFSFIYYPSIFFFVGGLVFLFFGYKNKDEFGKYPMLTGACLIGGFIVSSVHVLFLLMPLDSISISGMMITSTVKAIILSIAFCFLIYYGRKIGNKLIIITGIVFLFAILFQWILY